MQKYRKLLFISVFVFLAGYLIMLPVSPVQTGEDGFQAWVEEFKQEALERGISESTLQEFEDDFIFKSQVSSSVDRQAEFTVAFEDYKNWFVNDTMVERGIKKYKENSDTLARIEDKYGIPGKYSLAIWGIESRYGKHTSEYALIPALATLAYSHPRMSNYFRSELFTLLQIHEELYLPLKNRGGSWAGAMGQPQFMPSSYQAFAVDFSGTGWPDIWENEADILASITNYIYQHGWNENEGCAQRLDENEPVPEDKKLVTTGDNAQIRFAVTDNFYSIFNYNRSNHYALTVCYLADAIDKEISR